MPPPGVQWREPLHNFGVLICYDIVHIDDLVMTICYVIAVSITIADLVLIGCVFHGAPKVFVERTYAIAIAMLVRRV